jgi:hypothetical protein
VYSSEVLALCSSEVLARYSPSGFVKVFADARGGLFMAVYKASDRSITVHRYKAVRCQLLYYSGGFIKVFANTRGVGVSL